MKVVCTIAGSDSGGGAGIQADLKAISANGGFGTSVITAITAQNTKEVVKAQQISIRLIKSQFDAIFSDFNISAIKTGMLANVSVINIVAELIKRYKCNNYVLDPVMISKSGYNLLEKEAIDALQNELFPLATLITPNIYEAQVLSNMEIVTLKDVEIAGNILLEKGVSAVLIKGGHLLSEKATDTLIMPNYTEYFPGKWIETKNTHGTGCTYSAAIATHLAKGMTLIDAVATSKEYISEAISNGLELGNGSGPTDHFFYLRGKEYYDWNKKLNINS
jgi:hydroxymethylpyrimidine/phosphomethylpyrimidine kinase